MYLNILVLCILLSCAQTQGENGAIISSSNFFAKERYLSVLLNDLLSSKNGLRK